MYSEIVMEPSSTSSSAGQATEKKLHHQDNSSNGVESSHQEVLQHILDQPSVQILHLDETFSFQNVCMDIFSHLTTHMLKHTSPQFTLRHILILLANLTRNCKEIWCTDMNLLNFLILILQNSRETMETHILALNLVRNYIVHQHLSFEHQELSLLIETVSRLLLTLRVSAEDIAESQIPLIPPLFSVPKQLIKLHLIPQEALVPLCGSLCQTVFYPTLTHPSIVQAFSILKDMYIGKRAFQIMLDIMNFSPYVSFFRGAVYFVGMVSWGTERVEHLQVNYSLVLRAMLRVLSSNDSMIAYEVILNIRRLVNKYGKDLTVEWDTIIQIVERIKKNRNLASNSVLSKSASQTPTIHSEKIQMIGETLQETLHSIIKWYNEGKFFGDETRLIHLLDGFHEDSINGFVLDQYKGSLHPANQTWLRDWEHILSTYFEDSQISDTTKKTVLELFQSQLSQFASLSGEDLLSTALPFLQYALSSSRTSSQIRSSVLLLLKNIAADIRLTSRTFEKVVGLIASTTMDCDDDQTSQVAGVSALTELLQLKFDKLPCSEAPVIFSHLVAAASHSQLVIRKKALQLLLSLRSNPFFHLEINGISSPYLLCHSSDEPRRLSYVLPIPVFIEEILSRIIHEDDHELLQSCLMGVNEILLNSFLLKDFRVGRVTRAVTERTRKTIEKNLVATHITTFMNCLTVLSSCCGYSQVLDAKVRTEIIETLIASLTALLREQNPQEQHISKCIQIFTLCVHETPRVLFDNIGLVFECLRSIRERFDDNLPDSILISTFSFLHNVGVMAPKKYRASFVQDTFSFCLTFCTKKYLHFVRLFAYQVLMHWFTNCTFATRQGLIRMAMKTLYAEMHDGQSSFAETTMDFLLKYTFLSCEQSFDMNDQLANMFNNQQYKAWSLGNGVLTAQVGKFGHVLLRYRRPTGTIAWTMKLVNSIHHGVMKDEQFEEIPEYFNKFPMTTSSFSATDNAANMLSTNLSLSTKMSISPLLKEGFSSISESDFSGHVRETSVHSSESPNNSYFDPVVSSFEEEHDMTHIQGDFVDQHTTADSADMSSTDENNEMDFEMSIHETNALDQGYVEGTVEGNDPMAVSLSEDWGPLTMYPEPRDASVSTHSSEGGIQRSWNSMATRGRETLLDQHTEEYSVSLSSQQNRNEGTITQRDEQWNHSSLIQPIVEQSSAPIRSLVGSTSTIIPRETPASTPLIQRRRSQSTPVGAETESSSTIDNRLPEDTPLHNTITLPLSQVEVSVAEIPPLNRARSQPMHGRQALARRASLKRSSSMRKRPKTPKAVSPKHRERIISDVLNAIPIDRAGNTDPGVDILPRPSTLGDSLDSELTVDTSVLHPNFPYLFLRNWTFFSQEPPRGLKSSKQLTRALSMFDFISPHETLKIGVVFRGEKQETQSEILSNTFGSPRYFEFLKELGQFEPLCGMHPMYAGGLDTSEDKLDGDHTVTYRDEINHITFHVSTLMPNEAHDKNRSNKLKHIGNDYVIVVYSENLSDLSMNTFAGEFCIIQLLIFALESGLNKVQVKIKEKWQNSLPLMPLLIESHIVSDEALPQFIRVACIHADMATRSMRHSLGQYVSNWQHRLRQIKQIKERFSSDSSSMEDFDSAMRDLFDQ